MRAVFNVLVKRVVQAAAQAGHRHPKSWTASGTLQIAFRSLASGGKDDACGTKRSLDAMGLVCWSRQSWQEQRLLQVLQSKSHSSRHACNWADSRRP